MDNPRVCDMRRYNDKGDLTCVRCGQVLRGGRNPVCLLQTDSPESSPVKLPEAQGGVLPPMPKSQTVSGTKPRGCGCGGHKPKGLK